MVMSRKRLGQQLKDPTEAPRLKVSTLPKDHVVWSRTCQVGLVSLFKVWVKLTVASSARPAP